MQGGVGLSHGANPPPGGVVFVQMPPNPIQSASSRSGKQALISGISQQPNG